MALMYDTTQPGWKVPGWGPGSFRFCCFGDVGFGGAFGPAAAEEAEHEVRSPLRLFGERLGEGRNWLCSRDAMGIHVLIEVAEYVRRTAGNALNMRISLL